MINGSPNPAQKWLTGLDRKKPQVNPKVIISHRKISDPLSFLVLEVELSDRLMTIKRISDKANAKDIYITGLMVKQVKVKVEVEVEVKINI